MEIPYASPLSRRLEPAQGLTRREYKIASRDGTEISLWRVSTYWADKSSMLQPSIIYVHGGAFVMSNTDIGAIDLDAFNKKLISRLGKDPLDELGCVLLYVSYRVATACPFPGPPEDVCAAYSYALANAADLGILKDKICMMGISAGGNLAWAGTHMALDEGLPGPCGLIAIYPMLDPQATWAEHKEDALQYKKDKLHDAWAVYRSKIQDCPKNVQKYADLLQLPADDLSRLPPMYMDVGTNDYFMEEVLQAQEVLNQHNVKVIVVILDGMRHGFESQGKQDPGYDDALKKALQGRRSFIQQIWGTV
ncbi:hypothetical protein Dda_7074 [Drechslerella dactyloides]|uniref:Alpha/beta hydrolase fold-3 domain-containing protein n=1 Tax=Drechslerella dactyloides TaxID=74499 RepID=A0AAD6NHB0_DREDA|nr:hypothetical protein Dda_7074 [Drechslerella dactyloides]